MLLLLFLFGLEYSGKELLALFGLQIDLKSLPPALALATALTKVFTGYWAAGRATFWRFSARPSPASQNSEIFPVE